MSEQMEALRERLAWWKNDMAYKAPEQITGNYLATMLEDLEAALAARSTEPDQRCDKFDLNEHNLYKPCEAILFDTGSKCRVHGGKFPQ